MRSSGSQEKNTIIELSVKTEMIWMHITDDKGEIDRYTQWYSYAMIRFWLYTFKDQL